MTNPRNLSVQEGEKIDTTLLESLVGYNARRTSLAAIEVFLQHMGEFGLRTVDFSVASLILHNPGITSRQLCDVLGLLPPNLVGLLKGLEQRGLIVRRAHPLDGRALGLHATEDGIALVQAAEKKVTSLEAQIASRLSLDERKTLIRLLKKIYL
jgi:DNA-binding MarR family transcriptional regulator